MDARDKSSYKMTQLEWASIANTALADPVRMSLYNDLEALYNQMLSEDYETTDADINYFKLLHVCLMEREWQILFEHMLMR